MLRKSVKWLVVAPTLGVGGYTLARKQYSEFAFRSKNLFLDANELQKIYKNEIVQNSGNAIRLHPSVGAKNPERRRIVVVGGGIIGASTVYQLGKNGNNVDLVLVDRNPDAGLETSYQNGGLFSLSLCWPWTNWSNMMVLIKSFFNFDNEKLGTFKFGIGSILEPNFFTWGLNFLIRCSGPNADITNMKKLFNLASLSRRELTKLNEEDLSLADVVHKSVKGTLRLFQSKNLVDHFQEFPKHFKNLGGQLNWLNSTEEVKGVEAGLADSKVQHVAGAEMTLDFNMDCLKLTNGLINVAKEKFGAKFLQNNEVKKFVFQKDSQQCIGILTSEGFIPADDVIISSGNGSKPLMSLLGYKVPILAAKGFSVAVKKPSNRLPLEHNIYDENQYVYVTSLGDEYRISACAEFVGFDYSIPENRKKWLLENTEALVGDVERNTARFWTGFRPMSPDSAPIIGAIPGRARVWINSGHGAKGMVQALGSGKLISELVLGKETSISASDYSLNRFYFI
eukprot:TRINITY_DN3311_c0_g2_i1.p1 TRINITY_DN3311_c0_g2~~TRINITY_DN3311_c0_g2_i1.p1  ORF type:complete len:509 (+),score=121.25 TRINITY_DN3311_c0_g2_i1:56-1582(+)